MGAVSNIVINTNDKCTEETINLIINGDQISLTKAIRVQVIIDIGGYPTVVVTTEEAEPYIRLVE